MKAAGSILMLLAPVLLGLPADAATRVVDSRGTVTTVAVIAPAPGQDPPATGIRYEILRADGARTAGWVPPTVDVNPDSEPILLQEMSTPAPVLIWAHHDGHATQLAWARYTAGGWSGMRYLTSGPVAHTRPAAGIDARGTGYVVWVEPTDSGSVMLATFDPVTGNLLSSPRDLFQALVRASPPEWLSGEFSSLPTGALPPGEYPGGFLPDGGNDAPAIPPTNEHKIDEPVSGTITLGATCDKVAAAVIRQRALAIGILEGGVVLKYYRSVVPVGAPPDYVDLLLRSLVDQHCR